MPCNQSHTISINTQPNDWKMILWQGIPSVKRIHCHKDKNPIDTRLESIFCVLLHFSYHLILSCSHPHSVEPLCSHLYLPLLPWHLEVESKFHVIAYSIHKVDCTHKIHLYHHVFYQRIFTIVISYANRIEYVQLFSTG